MTRWKVGKKYPCRVLQVNEDKSIDFVVFTCNPQDEGTESKEEKANASQIARDHNRAEAFVAMWEALNSCDKVARLWVHTAVAERDFGALESAKRNLTTIEAALAMADAAEKA